MGREYKIVVNLNEALISDIESVFRKHNLFEKSYFFNDKEQFAFRRNTTVGAMPDFTICFDSDGIYICKHNCTEIFVELEELKKILDRKSNDYSILEVET